MTILACLLLLLAANGAPIIARELLGEQRWSSPIDHGRLFFDQRPWFGPHKTWRGMLAAVLATGAVAWLLGYPLFTGLAFGALAMLGDLLSSFIKRRMQLPAGGMALGLDQIPEALLPLLILKSSFGLAWTDIIWIVLLFVVLELLLSVILFRLGIRHKPY